MIVTIDDDIIYPPGMLAFLEERANAYPNIALSTAAICKGKWPKSFTFHLNHNPRSDWITWFKMRMPPYPLGRSVDFLMGYAGALYRRGHFPSTTDLYELEHKVFAPTLLYRSIFMNDDIYLSAYICSRGVHRMIFTTPDIERYRTINRVSEDALSYNVISMFNSLQRAIAICEAIGLINPERDYAPVAIMETFSGPIVVGLSVLVLMVTIGLPVIKK
jgi:hypothetical protein